MMYHASLEWSLVKVKELFCRFWESYADLALGLSLCLLEGGTVILIEMFGDRNCLLAKDGVTVAPFPGPREGGE